MTGITVPIRLGILGCGKAGRQHVEALRNLESCNVVAVYDTQPEQTTEGVERARNFEELLHGFKLDAVSFCCPPGSRIEEIERCIELRKGVLVEKPPASSISEHRRIVRLGREFGVPVHCMLQHRFRVPQSTLHMDRRNAYGSLLVSRFRPNSALSGSWHGDTALSLGGIVSHLGIHYLDIAVEWLGEPISFVPADISLSAPGIERALSGTMIFDSEATLALAITGETPGRTEALHVVSHDGSESLIDGTYTSVASGAASEVVSVLELRRRVYEDFAQCIRGKSAAQIEPDRARCSLARTERIQKAMDLIREHVSGASREGRER